MSISEGAPTPAEITSEQTLDPLEAFAAYAISEAARNRRLDRLLSDALPRVTDIHTANELLREQGREDLCLTDKAPMHPVRYVRPWDGPRLETMSSTNNFASGFRIYTGWRPSTEAERRVRGGSELMPIGITKEQLAGVIAGTNTIDPDCDPEMTHLAVPAFHRAYVLFPDFVGRTTAMLSAPENRHQLDHFFPELYVLHQIMAELVDRSDPGVVRADAVNSGYLRG